MRTLIFVMFLTLIANSQCGLVDGFINKIKDTTHSVTHGVGEVFHYGKSFVFGSETYEEGRAVTKPGIIGRISLGIHDAAQSVRNAVRNVFEMFDGTKHEKGIMGRFYDKLKYRFFNINIFSTDYNNTNVENKPQPQQKLGNDTAVLREKLKKFVFTKNKIHGECGLRQILLNMRDAINNIRYNNMTKPAKDSNTKNDEEDGVGLIDVRQSASGIGEVTQDDFENGIDAAYDKVEEGINEGRDRAKDLVNKAQQSSNDFIENQRKKARDQINEINNNANKLKQNSNDFIEKQRENVRNNIYEVSDNAHKLKNDVHSAYDKVKEGIVEGGQQTSDLMNKMKQESGTFIQNQRKNANEQLDNSVN